MTGPDHYVRAAELLVSARTLTHRPTAELHAMMAQAHATLALTAATIDSAYEVDTIAGWEGVLRD